MWRRFAKRSIPTKSGRHPGRCWSPLLQDIESFMNLLEATGGATVTSAEALRSLRLAMEFMHSFWIVSVNSAWFWAEAMRAARLARLGAGAAGPAGGGYAEGMRWDAVRYEP